LLYLTGRDLLLVRGLTVYLGIAEPRRHALASFPGVVSGHNLLAAAVGCVANWFRNRTLHCGITAPIFLAGGVAFLLSDMRMVQINSGVVWPLIFTGIGIAFLLEWQYVRRCVKS